MAPRPRPRPRPLSTSAGAVPALAMVLALAGCASTQEGVLPRDGPTMKTLYDAHFEAMGESALPTLRHGFARPLESGPAALAGFTRRTYRELDTRFPRLPNPSLVMYVYPHLAGPEGVPVPGYVTTFPLYEGVEYALPGEVPGPAVADDVPGE